MNISRRTHDATARSLYGDVRQDVTSVFFSAPELSFRRAAQALNRLGLVLASLRSDQWSYPIMAVVALILRTIDSDLYRRFHSGDASDLEIVEKVFAPSGTITLEKDEIRFFAERMIILAGREVSGSTDSPLLELYKKMVDDEDTESINKDPHRTRAQQMIAWADDLPGRGPHIGFQDSVHRIELLSAGLIGEH